MRRRPLAVMLLLLPLKAQASGFHIDEQDARATGRAGAITANPTNASAIYYNPAGVGGLDGMHADAGLTVIGPSAKFRLATTGAETPADSEVFFLPSAYVTYRVDEFWGLGIGVNTPFGLSIAWPATSPGRANTRSADLRTFFITPSIGFDLSTWVPGLSLGGGLDLVPASVKLDRDILFGDQVGTVALGGRAFGVGARAGLLYRPKGLEHWSFGLTYRSPVKLTFSGTANFDAPPEFRSNLPPDGDAKTSVVLPQTLDVGVAFNPLPEWQIEADVNWLGWSSYDRLFVELPGNAPPDISNKDWKDTFAVRVGTEYTLAKQWSGRLGFVWDETPVPDTTLDFQLPDMNRYVVTAGVGAAFTPNVHADLGAIYIVPVKRSTSNADPYQPPVKGQFNIEAWVVTLSVGFTLPTGPAAPPGGSASPLTESIPPPAPPSPALPPPTDVPPPVPAPPDPVPPGAPAPAPR